MRACGGGLYIQSHNPYLNIPAFTPHLSTSKQCISIISMITHTMNVVHFQTPLRCYYTRYLVISLPSEKNSPRLNAGQSRSEYGYTWTVEMRGRSLTWLRERLRGHLFSRGLHLRAQKGGRLGGTVRVLARRTRVVAHRLAFQF